MVKVRERVQKVRESNCEIAIKNMDFEPQLEEKRLVLAQKCNELRELRDGYDKRFLELSKRAQCNAFVWRN